MYLPLTQMYPAITTEIITMLLIDRISALLNITHKTHTDILSLY